MYRCGLIGCGVISRTHLDVIDHHPDLECLAICDWNETFLEELAKYHEGIYMTKNYRDLLNPDQIDLIFVLTDHASHSEIAVEAIKAGVAVICEKPVTANSEQLEVLMKKHRACPMVYAGGIFQNRFNPNFQRLKDWVDGGELGTILTLQLNHRCFRGDTYYANSSWRGRLESEGGSAMINQSIHFVDYLLQLGGDVERLAGFASNRIHQHIIETEDTFSGILNFKSGILGSFCLTNGAKDDWAWSVTVAGTKGTIVLSGKGMSFSGLDFLEQIWTSTQRNHTEFLNNSGLFENSLFM